MRRVSIPNPTVEETYKTYIDSDLSAAGTSLTVRNNSSFAANDLLLIGNPREENTEIKQVASTSGGTGITLSSGVTFAHNKGTPIYKILWNFVSIERRTSSGGSFSEITQSGLQYDNQLGLTIYFDSPADDNYGYRFRYYNSVGGTYSEYSPTQTGAAPDRDSVRYMLSRVRKLINDVERRKVSDDEIIRVFNLAQDIIYTYNPKYWFLYVDTLELGSGSIAATVNTARYTLANLTNFGHLASLRYRYTSGETDNIYHLKKEVDVVFDRYDSNQNITAMNYPAIYKLVPADSSSANGYFKVTPKIKDSNVGTFYPNYYKKMPNLDTVDDETLTPLPDLLIGYAVGYCYKLLGQEQKAVTYLSEIENLSGNDKVVPPGLARLDKMNENQKRVVGQPQYVARFRGQKAIRRLYGERFPMSDDFWRENYF